MTLPINRTAKTALDTNLVNGITSDAPKVKASNDVLYNTIDELNSKVDSHTGAPTLAHPDGSVSRAKLALKAVGPSQLDDASVGQTHHQDNGIPSRAMPDNVILKRHMSDSSVGSSEIQPGAVQTQHIASGAVTADKFVPGALANDTQNGLRITALEAETITKSVMPDKSGVKTKSPKIVIVGSTNDVIKVAQYIGNKYVFYTFQAAQGDTSANSVGGNWDLIRIKKAELSAYAHVAKTSYDVPSTVGTIGTLYAPSLRNFLEAILLSPMTGEDSTLYESSRGNGFGLGLYSISNPAAISSVTWKLTIGTKRKVNILVYGSPGSSASADILVNGEVVKSFDPTKLVVGGTNRCKIIEFDVPYADGGDSVDITLRNNDTTGKVVYFSCCNYMLLKDYDGSDIDFYKVFTTNSKFIDADGSSDYAIFDTDLNKWCGSFHGGETRISAKIMWQSGTSWRPANQWDAGRLLMLDKSSVAAGWMVTPSFKIQQITNINNKGTMLSTFDFDVDGTIEMDFSFYDGSIKTSSFFTALTATHVDFTYVKYPRHEVLPSGTTPLYFGANDGEIKQMNLLKNLTLGIRFTRFLSQYQNSLKKNGWIHNDATFYKKFYYGYVDAYTGSVPVSNLQFKKALDFSYE